MDASRLACLNIQYFIKYFIAEHEGFMLEYILQLSENYTRDFFPSACLQKRWALSRNRELLCMNL